METFYFILGMLSIIAIAIVATIVWGIVKINKQKQQISSLNQQLDGIYRYIDDRFSGVYSDLDDRSRWINERLDKNDESVDRRFNEVYSYVDSRIDKATSGLNGAKQVIKG
jgi:predicted PurR-regulated permease PerM